MDKYNTKQCSKCEEILPLNKEYFHVHKSSKNGFRSQCKVCRRSEGNQERKRAKSREWKKKNSEHIKQYRKEYYESNKEESYLQSIEYYNKNKDKINANCRRRYKENPERFRKRNNDYYKKNAEKLREWQRQWRIKNPERQKIIATRTWIKRKSLTENLPNDFTHKQWNECIEYFCNSCAYCGREEPLAQDHFIALTKGGEYTRNNIIPSCKSCNSSKHNKSFFDWYPNHEYYSKKREKKILDYLGYNNNIQQLSIL